MDKTQRERWLNLPADKVFFREADFGKGKQPEVHKDILQSFYPDFPLLPIELLKSQPDGVEKSFRHKPVHHFISSGTTARDRSRSAFSKNGLSDYREFSVRSFEAMLQNFFPGPKRVPGISMIPPTQEWPSSSLAQMIAWLGEIHPLTYWNEQIEIPREPVWLFATGFHIVNFADDGGYFPLPAGSVVIETGGTKGKSRSVSREETYAMIEKCFRVDRNFIVSEYGMCELASQAYDFVSEPKGPPVALTERRFRFPAWAQTRVLNAKHEVQKSGVGSLIVHDCARSDIGTPLRTEDKVNLEEDGSFQLRGRVAFSPLKGCSLLAEEVLKETVESEIESFAHHSKYVPIWKAELRTRAAVVHDLTQKMLEDPKFKELVYRSLGLEKPSEWWLEDLRASVPKSVDEWVAAVERSQNHSPSWLFIPPRTHDFAIMHPLFLAAVLKVKVVVRETGEAALLRYWHDLFEDFWAFATVNEDWRVQEGTALPAQSILVFGSDETIQALQDLTSHPIRGFGTWITVSAIHASSFSEGKWIKDAFSLRQEGCMSSRLLIVWDDDVPNALPIRTVSIGELTPAEQLHLAHSELDMALNGFEVTRRMEHNELVIAQKTLGEGEKIQDLLSTRPLTLPIIRVNKREFQKLYDEITRNASFKLLSLDSQTLGIVDPKAGLALREIGRANQAPWTGWHGAEPLFFPKNPAN